MLQGVVSQLVLVHMWQRLPLCSSAGEHWRARCTSQMRQVSPRRSTSGPHCALHILPFASEGTPHPQQLQIPPLHSSLRPHCAPQVLPFASEGTLEKLEANLKALGSVSHLLAAGNTPQDITHLILADIGVAEDEPIIVTPR
jgi:hypothetical protein